MGCLLRSLFALTSAAFLLLVGGVALAAFLMLNGTPEPCVDRAVDPAPPASRELQANWLEMREAVARGETITVSVTELQASALGREYLRERDVPVERFAVRFCPDGTAEALGRLGVMGLQSDVLVKGRLDVSGERPRIEVDSVKAGAFPERLARALVQATLDEQRVLTLDLLDNIEDIEYRDGEVVVTVQP